MRRRTRAAAATVCVALLDGTGVAAARTQAIAVTRAARAAHGSPAGGSWGKAEQVPGLAALNKGGGAEFNSISCPSAGNCSGGGDYFGASQQRAFVVGETGGTWQKAEQVPGLAAFHQPGNCAAGGEYSGKSGQQQGVRRQPGQRHVADGEGDPGVSCPQRGDSAYVAQVSCASAGNCAAGGSYAATPVSYQGFVVTEANGTWQTAEQVPGLGALNNAGFAGTFAPSCPAPGSCGAGGYYTYQGPGQTHRQSAFIVSQTRS